MAAQNEFDWQAILDGTDPRYRRFRSILRRIPSAPRCKMCAAPFEGPGAPLMRAMGRGRWRKNPTYCRACETFLDDHQGGAETELTFLFADVRGSTAIGERLTPKAFSDLLNRFYDVASRVVIDHEGLVDKFVGDEVVAFFRRRSPVHGTRTPPSVRRAPCSTRPATGAPNRRGFRSAPACTRASHSSARSGRAA